jgi:hypothetical protein
MFFPYWFREDSDGVFEMVNFDQLPESLKEVVKAKREEIIPKGKEG